MIIVRFRTSGAFHFFKTWMHDIADEMVFLEELWGRQGRELKDTLVHADSTTERLDQLNRFLIEQLEQASNLCGRRNIITPSSVAAR
jgi:hypothetical protein